MLAFLTTLVLICLVSLAAFSVRALPVWIWPALLFSFAVSGQIDRFHLRQPASREEACAWRCENAYGRGDEVGLSRGICVNECRLGYAGGH